MFPAGVAGIALFLLRVASAASVVLITGSFRVLSEPTPMRLAATLTSVLLLLGAATPLSCVMLLLLAALSMRENSGTVTFYIVLQLLSTTSLLMLGPGAYSVDARLFGRRLIVPPR